MTSNKAYIIMWRTRGDVIQHAVFYDTPTYDDAKDFAESLANTENTMDVVVYETSDHWRILVSRIGEKSDVIERGPVIKGPTDNREAA
jgi:hypothetical protein